MFLRNQFNFGDICVVSVPSHVQKVETPREEDSYCSSLRSISWGPDQASSELRLLEVKG